MTISQFLRDKGMDCGYEVIGSDIDIVSLETARAGLYPVSEISDIPVGLVEKSVRIGEEQFRMAEELSSHVRFVCHRLGENDPPLSIEGYFHVVFLRNLLIYMPAERAKAALGEVMKAISPLGTVITGESDPPPLESSGLKRISGCIYERDDDGSGIARVRGEVSVVSGSGISKPIRLLMVDDSKSIHVLFKQMLEGVSDIDIVASAFNGKEALAKIQESKPDVIISDIHMPEMDGITFLDKQMKEFRIPTIMLSSITKEDAVQVLRAYEKGAVDYIEKPKNLDIRTIREAILAKIRNTARANMKYYVEKKLKEQLDIVIARPNRKLILIGASTGGPETLARILESFPRECPPVVVAQHMPAFFTKVFADRLATRIAPSVKEAFHQDALMPEHVYIAPGDHHVAVRFINGVLRTEFVKEERSYIPSVDLLFESGASISSEIGVVGVVLTGMGSDGALGVQALHKVGAHVIAQDVKTSVAVGMPNAAIATNCVDTICSVDGIAKAIFDSFQMGSAASKFAFDFGAPLKQAA
jgi:two-component system chemotaxis response regulator CheB